MAAKVRMWAAKGWGGDWGERCNSGTTGGFGQWGALWGFIKTAVGAASSLSTGKKGP